MNVNNQKEDLHEAKPMAQAIVIGSRKAMLAKTMGIKLVKSKIRMGTKSNSWTHFMN